LGEFSHFGWLSTLSSFCENYRRSANNWATFFNNKSYHKAIAKVDWATGWATFSFARLVTLASSARLHGFSLRKRTLKGNPLEG
jgi:hypothetical protein